MGTREFWQARKQATEDLIVAYEGAVLALADGGAITSYTLDTGQSRQTVTRSDLNALTAKLDSLYNRYATLCARLEGGVHVARPSF